MCSKCVKGFRISQAANSVVVSSISTELLARTCLLKNFVVGMQCVNANDNQGGLVLVVGVRIENADGALLH